MVLIAAVVVDVEAVAVEVRAAADEELHRVE